MEDRRGAINQSIRRKRIGSDMMWRTDRRYGIHPTGDKHDTRQGWEEEEDGEEKRVCVEDYQEMMMMMMMMIVVR